MNMLLLRIIGISIFSIILGVLLTVGFYRPLESCKPVLFDPTSSYSKATQESVNAWIKAGRPLEVNNINK